MKIVIRSVAVAPVATPLAFGAAHAQDAKTSDAMKADCMDKARMETDAMKAAQMEETCGKGAVSTTKKQRRAAAPASARRRRQVFRRREERSMTTRAAASSPGPLGRSPSADATVWRTAPTFTVSCSWRSGSR